MSDQEVVADRSKLARTLGGIVVVVIAVGALAVGLIREGERAPAVQTEPAAASVVTVYYFHGDTRCDTCRAIESKTTDAVLSNFGAEIEAGALRLEIVNFDTPSNRHFREDFDLAFGSVVVEGRAPDLRWENLADVWTLVHGDSAEFERYVSEHVRTYLES